MIKLKNESEVSDRRLGCIYVENTERLQYPIMKLVGEKKKPRSYTWSCGKVLDQGKEGSCVGHGVAHELIARPSVVEGIDHIKAVEIYHLAQSLDPWPGSNYEGTTVDAGAKAAMQMGYIDSYYWALYLEDLILGIGYAGPSVIGVTWYEGMFDTDKSGYIHPTGRPQGGHCVCLNGVNIKGEYFKGVNSWGNDWGTNGTFKISFKDMELLLKNQGVACFFKGRHKK